MSWHLPYKQTHVQGTFAWGINEERGVCIADRYISRALDAQATMQNADKCHSVLRKRPLNIPVREVLAAHPVFFIIENVKTILWRTRFVGSYYHCLTRAKDRKILNALTLKLLRASGRSSFCAYLFALCGWRSLAICRHAICTDMNKTFMLSFISGQWYATFSFRASECTQAFHARVWEFRPWTIYFVLQKQRKWSLVWGIEWVNCSIGKLCVLAKHRTIIFPMGARNIFKIWLRHMCYACALM